MTTEFHPFTVLRTSDNMYLAVPANNTQFSFPDNTVFKDEAPDGLSKEFIVGSVELDDDYEIAVRKLALRLVLDDFTKAIEHSWDYQLTVNERKEKSGESPDDVVANIEALRLALSGTPLESAELQRLLAVGYGQINHVLASCDPPRGTTQILNAAYHLVTEGKATYADAWLGHTPADTRQTHTVNDGEYLVVTDYEADELWDQELENYIDECLDIPDAISSYFDRERWKDDARVDGRAHSLNRYDGGEEYVVVDDVTYYVYRQN